MEKALKALRERQRQKATKQKLPIAWVLTDPRLSDIEAYIPQIPSDIGLIIRDYETPQREKYVKHLSQWTSQAGLITLVAANPELAKQCDVAGVHWPSWASPQPIQGQLTIFAVHNHEELLRAEAFNADAVIISPVFETKSHPDTPHLGLEGLHSLIKQTTCPVYAMGGITSARMQSLLELEIYGIAGISFLKELPRR